MVEIAVEHWRMTKKNFCFRKNLTTINNANCFIKGVKKNDIVALVK